MDEKEIFNMGEGRTDKLNRKRWEGITRSEFGKYIKEKQE